MNEIARNTLRIFFSRILSVFGEYFRHFRLFLLELWPVPSLNCENVISPPPHTFYRDILITKGIKKRSVSGFPTLHKKIAMSGWNPDIRHGLLNNRRVQSNMCSNIKYEITFRSFHWLLVPLTLRYQAYTFQAEQSNSCQLNVLNHPTFDQFIPLKS